MKLQLLSLLVFALLAATTARSFPSYYQSEEELQQYRGEMGVRPTASDQSHTQHEQATAMARDITSIAINKPLTTGQTIQVEYMSPSSGRVYVQLETANNYLHEWSSLLFFLQFIHYNILAMFHPGLASASQNMILPYMHFDYSVKAMSIHS